MGIERINTVAAREFHGKLHGIVLPRPKPTEAPELTLRQKYRAVRASLPPKLRGKACTPLIVRALIVGDRPWGLVTSGRRLPHITAIKQRIAWIIYETTGWSSPVVARLIGLSHHTTVIHARHRIESLIEQGVETDRGVPFLRPRDVARVAAIKARRESFARIQKAADEARERTEAAAYAARMEKRQNTLLGCIAQTVGIEHQPIIDRVLRQFTLVPSRLVGPAHTFRAVRARDTLLFRLSKAGVHRDAMSSAFAISKAAVTMSVRRGEYEARECAP